jgi:magnesium transporter
VIQDLDADDAAGVLADAKPAVAARIAAHLGPETRAGLVRRIPRQAAAQLLSACEPAVTTSLLRRLDTAIDPAAFLASLPAPRRRELQDFLSYPEDSAGSLMDPAAPVFRVDERAGDVARALRESGRDRDLVVLVIDADGVLIGTLPVVTALLADPGRQLRELPLTPSPTVQAFDHRDQVAELLEGRRLHALPVVDVNGRPVGMLRHGALARVAEQEVAADMQSMDGASRDERALSSVSFAVRKRLPWLQVNLATAFLAAAVVGLFEDTIAQFTALAILLPVVAGQSGNTGAQSLAVTMRGLSLHEIGLRQWARVVTKEAFVGLLNGIAVALVTMAGVYVWSASLGLCLVIGLAMVMSMAIAGVAGASVPLLLRAAGQDPAQSSSIVLTTVTDVMGFLSFLGLATIFASWL